MGLFVIRRTYDMQNKERDGGNIVPVYVKLYYPITKFG
jgi:hypothetical protein